MSLRLFATALLAVCVLLLSATATPAAAVAHPKVSVSVLSMDITLQLFDAFNGTAAYIETVFQGTAGKDKASSGYLSHGIAPIAMTGPMVACQFPSATGATACSDLSGDGFDADTTTLVTKVISSNITSAGLVTVVIQTPTSFYKVSPGAARWIFARGEWETEKGKDEPGDHGGHWWQADVDLYAGTVAMSSDSSNIYIVLVVTWIVTMLLALFGAALKQCHQSRSRTVTWICYSISSALILGCFAACVAVADGEYKKQANFAPTARAFGIGACYLFSIILFPTTKYLNLGEWAVGISYDRQIAFHVYGGYFLVLVVLVHFFWFLIKSAQLGFVGMLFGWEEGVQATLPAFLAFIVLLIFTLGGLLRGFSYFWFRISHMLFPLLVIGFCIHFPALAVCLTPGLLIYISDLVLRLLRTKSDDVKVSAVEVDAASKVVKLKCAVGSADGRKRWARAHSGQYVIFSGLGLSFMPHPFTFAHRSADGSEIVFYIKAAGDFTETLFEMATNHPGQLVGQTFQTFVGPVGETEIDLTVPTDVVLVSGGIGVTATLGLLYTYAERTENTPLSVDAKMNDLAVNAMSDPEAVNVPTKSGGECAVEECEQCTKLRSVTFVWSCREPSLAQMMLPQIEECSKRFRSVSFVAKIFVTGKGGENMSSSSDRAIEIVAGRRPDAKDMEPLETRKEGKVCYFSCGPAPLMAQVHEVAQSRDALEHAEVFTF